MNCVHDTKALELSREVMALMYGPIPTGGSVQLQAKIQCLFADAMDFAAGNSPAVPDGWIKCSERMPEVGEEVVVFRPRAEESKDPKVKTAIYKGGREYYHGFDCYCEPSHWMSLPAAPQPEAE